MDRNMYNTLKADENQLIKYTLSGYDILDGTASPSAFTANTTGTLVVAGQEKPIAMKINAERLSDGKAVAQGEQKLRMSDFGISPPNLSGFVSVEPEGTLETKLELRQPQAS